MHVIHQYQTCLLIRLASVEMASACFCDGTFLFYISCFLILRKFDLHKELFMEIGCLGTTLTKLKYLSLHVFDANVICFEAMTMGGSLSLITLQREICPEIEDLRSTPYFAGRSISLLHVKGDATKEFICAMSFVGA